jgi:FxsC-like protein
MSISQSSVHDDQRPYFFLSYARARVPREGRHDPDRWVAKFYRDLCDDVSEVTGSAHPGFMDRETPAGAEWPAELANALSACRVFVALYSPAYFRSDYCGKEWAAFTRRIEMNGSGRAATAAIIPALWITMPDHELPAMVRSKHYVTPDFPAAYRDEGLYGIIKLNRYRDAYKQTVLKMARLIKEVANNAALMSCEPQDLLALRSAFHEHQDQRHPIRLTIAARDMGHLPEGLDAYYYGRTVREWSPYRTSADATPLAYHAERIVANLGHEPVVDTIEEYQEGAPGSPGVMLVDPWATVDRDLGERLRRIDARPLHVVVPWNEDEQNTRAEAELDRGLDETLGNSLALNGSARRLTTIEAFRAALPKAVAEAVTRHLQTVPVYPPADPPSMERPTLKGPGGGAAENR